MEGFISIPNLERWQHYKDRCPPWIKLHRDILNDYKYSCLQDASKLHLMMIWLLASQMDNKLPNDPKWIASRINATDPVNLKELIKHGFIVADSTALASCEQVDIAEAETETETETEGKQPCPGKPEPFTVSVDEIFGFWRETLNHPHAKIGDKRRKLICARLKDGYTVDDLKDAVSGCSLSPFHMGDNDRRQIYDGVELIFRDAGKIDGFIKICRDPNSRPTPEQPIMKETANQRFHRELNDAQRRVEAAIHGQTNLAIGAN